MAARKLTCLGPLLAALLSCSDGSEDERTTLRPGSSDVVEAEILTGASLAGIVPGESLGVFVEYAGDGEWSVEVTCDTRVTRYLCEWDVYLSPVGGNTLEYEAVDLEDDWVIPTSDEVALHTYTDYGFDGITVFAEPGYPMQVQVVLDALSATRDPFPGRYIEWVGAEGVVHLGAPSNPIILDPTEP